MKKTLSLTCCVCLILALMLSACTKSVDIQMIVDTFNAEADTQAEELFAGQATTKMEVKNDNTILWIIALNMDIDTFNETITAQMDETLPPMAEEMLETYRETGLKDLGIELVITNSAGTELYTKEFR